MKSFGMYKGAGGDELDRSVFNELWSAPTIFRRDIKSLRTMIDYPRLNLCLLGHPHEYVRTIYGERMHRQDGLIQRFLVCAPEPAFLNYDDIMNAPSHEFSLSCILYLVCKLNQCPITYTLSPEATVVFKEHYTQFKELLRITNNLDIFLR